ncbi:unnamed protein product [Rhodiola kirilowii]
MPKKKRKSSNKPKRRKNNKRQIDEYKQKTNCSDLIDGTVELSTFSDHIIDDSGDEEVSEFSINSILQSDLLEQILVYLPIASMVKAGLVCKKWREITTSKRFLLNASQTVPQKPWYFMHIDDYHYVQSWYAYDPILQKWQRIEFLDMMESFRICDSSDGLVCYRKKNEIYVCNPITRETKKLPRLTYFGCSLFTNISVNQRSHNYIVSVLTFQLVAGSREELSFHVYDSATMSWSASQMEVLRGWISGHKSVICNRVIYFLVRSRTIRTSRGPSQFGLLAYNFSSDSSSLGELLHSFIPLPCSNICGLINLKGKLIIVAAIGRSGDEELNFGFSIWLLKGKDWQEISRITHTCFGNSDEAFRCSGAGDLIYIRAHLRPQIVVFDMKLKQWKDFQKCPMGMGDFFNGFCLQPRLDISP